MKFIDLLNKNYIAGEGRNTLKIISASVSRLGDNDAVALSLADLEPTPSHLSYHVSVEDINTMFEWLGSHQDITNLEITITDIIKSEVEGVKQAVLYGIKNSKYITKITHLCVDKIITKQAQSIIASKSGATISAQPNKTTNPKPVEGPKSVFVKLLKNGYKGGEGKNTLRITSLVRYYREDNEATVLSLSKKDSSIYKVSVDDINAMFEWLKNYPDITSLNIVIDGLDKTQAELVEKALLKGIENSTQITSIYHLHVSKLLTNEAQAIIRKKAGPNVDVQPNHTQAISQNGSNNLVKQSTFNGELAGLLQKRYQSGEGRNTLTISSTNSAGFTNKDATVVALGAIVGFKVGVEDVNGMFEWLGDHQDITNLFINISCIDSDQREPVKKAFLEGIRNSKCIMKIEQLNVYQDITKEAQQVIDTRPAIVAVPISEQPKNMQTVSPVGRKHYNNLLTNPTQPQSQTQTRPAISQNQEIRKTGSSNVHVKQTKSQWPQVGSSMLIAANLTFAMLEFNLLPRSSVAFLVFPATSMACYLASTYLAESVNATLGEEQGELIVNIALPCALVLGVMVKGVANQGRY